MIQKALHTGWSRGWLPPDSGEVQRCPLNPWWLHGCQLQPQQGKVQHQVSQTLTPKIIRMKLTTSACPGTGTRMDTAATTAPRFGPVGGGIGTALMPTPPVWAVQQKRGVRNMLLIIMEEREGTAGTVGPRQSTCLSPTETSSLWKVFNQSSVG